MNKNPLLKGGMYRKAILLVLIVGIVMSIFMVPASAARMSQDPYDTYTYWTAPGAKKDVSSAAMYEYETTITGADLGLSVFSTPTDVFVDDAGFIYFTDNGNNRIIVMNPDYTLKTIIESVKYKGETLTFNKPSATFVTKKGDI